MKTKKTITTELRHGFYIKADWYGYKPEDGGNHWRVRIYQHGDRKPRLTKECHVKANMSDTLQKHVERAFRGVLKLSKSKAGR